MKGQNSDSGVVESDTDTMSCCDDDSSPDHYQPIIESHHCRGVVDKNKSVGKFVTLQDGGVAERNKTADKCICDEGVAETGSINTNSNFPPLSNADIVLSDDPELDKIFASVEVSSDPEEDDYTNSYTGVGMCGQMVMIITIPL